MLTRSGAAIRAATATGTGCRNSASPRPSFVAMVSWHTVIGVGEAVVTFLVVSAVVATRPDLVHGARPALAARRAQVQAEVAA